MVSIKSVLTLVLLAAVCANAIYVKPTAIRKCSQGYYSKWNLNYNNEWKKSTNLIRPVFGLVDGLLDSVEGLLGNLLGGLFGGKTNSILDKVFAPANNEGSIIQMLIRITILNAPIYDRVNPGLSKIYLKATIANIINGVSVRGGRRMSGLGFSPLTGNRSTWVRKSGGQNILQEWNDHLVSIGGLRSLSRAQRIHYDLIGSLVANLVGGTGFLVNGLLDKVLYDVVGNFALLANLLDSSTLESVLEDSLDLVSDLLVSIDDSVFRNSIKRKISQYDSSQFCNSFRCY